MVQKEMFTFLDKGEREMALRPEGTPGAVRAYIEHNLYKLAQPIKLFYIGPMFRQERQQKGRYRQHTQIGVEVLGTSDPLVDVEVISLLYAIHRAVGVKDEIVHLNNLGDAETQRSLRPRASSLPAEARGELDPDSLARMDTNPLRTFDSKHEGTQAVLAEAPRITSFLSEEASAHLAAVTRGSRGARRALRDRRRARARPRLLHDDGVRGQERRPRGAGHRRGRRALQRPDLRPWGSRPRGDRVRLRRRADAACRRLAGEEYRPGRVLRHPRPRGPHPCHAARRRPARGGHLRRPRLRGTRDAGAVQAGRPRRAPPTRSSSARTSSRRAWSRCATWLREKNERCPWQTGRRTCSVPSPAERWWSAQGLDLRPPRGRPHGRSYRLGHLRRERRADLPRGPDRALGALRSARARDPGGVRA